MTKTRAVLLVSLGSLAALAGCAHHDEPAQSPQANAGATEQTHGASPPGVAEPMPTQSTDTPAPTDSPQQHSTDNGVSGGSSAASAPGATAPTQGTTSWSDGQILEVVHTANKGEIEQAQLASHSASNARVRRFAALMIKDHTAADDEVASEAKSLSVHLEPSLVNRNLEADARSNSSALQSRTGVDFDRAYMQAQISEDQAILATIDNELMPHAQSTDVKNLLTKVRGKVMHHLQQAQDLDAALSK